MQLSVICSRTRTEDTWADRCMHEQGSQSHFPGYHEPICLFRELTYSWNVQLEVAGIDGRGWWVRGGVCRCGWVGWGAYNPIQGTFGGEFRG